MGDRLRESIRKCCAINLNMTQLLEFEILLLTDHILADGWMRPPCKVGDTAYFIIEDEIEGGKYITSQRINDVSTRGIFVSTSSIEENCEEFEPYSEFGKTVFLTKEEAEEVLKERF